MPLSIPQQNAPSDYISFGQGRRWASGYVIVLTPGGLVDLVLGRGSHASLANDVGPWTLAAGPTPFYGTPQNVLAGFKIRLNPNSPVSPVSFVAGLFEPGEVAIAPAFGSGAAPFSQQLDVTDGVIDVKPTTTIFVGSNLVLTNLGGGEARVDGSAQSSGVWQVAQPVAPASAPPGSVAGVSFVNGWANAQLPDGSYSPLRYRTIDGGFELEGVVAGGSFGSTIITLPLAYRPADDFEIPIASADGSRLMALSVTSAGVVSVSAATSAASLPASGVTAGQYGTATQVGQFTVNEQGLLTAAVNVAITFPVSSVFGRTGGVVAANGDYNGVVASALTGATAATRYVGATASGAPGSGTFAVGDFVVAQDGALWVCTVAGTPGTWVNTGGSVNNAVRSVFGRTGSVVAVDGDYSGVVASALTGATAATRYAGATASGAPASGTFAVGDFVIDQTGALWVCTGAGSPGTWKSIGGGPKIYLNKPAGAITRTGTTVGAFSTAWQITGVAVAASQNVDLRMSAQVVGTGHDFLFALFRGASQIAAKIWSSTSVAALEVHMEWVDENPGAGTYTYEVRCAAFTSGTLTVEQGNGTGDAGSSGGSVFVAEVYTP